jgi:cyclopropane fatty-acyl-phospholipid synthase-like methyltransferase
VTTPRLPDAYFDRMYAASADPWHLANSWYERRKHQLTVAMLPYQRYRHALEPGCSIGTLTELLTKSCDHVTATDVATAALDAADRRLREAGLRQRVTLLHRSLDQPWPPGGFDLVVLSDVAYYLQSATLRAVLDRECAKLARGATVIAAHWRRPVHDNPISGDHANDIIGATTGLHTIATYRDADLVIEMFDTASAASVAARNHAASV